MGPLRVDPRVVDGAHAAPGTTLLLVHLHVHVLADHQTEEVDPLANRQADHFLLVRVALAAAALHHRAHQLLLPQLVLLQLAMLMLLQLPVTTSTVAAAEGRRNGGARKVKWRSEHLRLAVHVQVQRKGLLRAVVEDLGAEEAHQAVIGQVLQIASQTRPAQLSGDHHQPIAVVVTLLQTGDSRALAAGNPLLLLILFHFLQLLLHL